MPSEPAKPSTSGIVTDDTGERHIPESQRADGTTRKAIKIRPGYRPPEDVEIYKNRTAETFRNRNNKGGVIGAEGLKEQKQEAAAASAASNKNAKRREARKKAKSTNTEAAGDDDAPGDASAAKAEEVDPEVEREKKARNLKKKLKQAKDLKNKKDGGESLLPEQIAKVIKINELVRELEALGFDADGEPKSATASTSAPKSDEAPEAVKDV
ncbi:Mago binding-domain-containing protein [Jackrogersella minutella]|nr:Mago binding-domain-containing protein [Jackrogersella minutella]